MRLSIEKIEEKSKEIKERLFSLEEISEAQNIFTYVNFSSEVATKEIRKKGDGFIYFFPSHQYMIDTLLGSYPCGPWHMSKIWSQVDFVQ